MTARECELMKSSSSFFPSQKSRLVCLGPNSLPDRQWMLFWIFSILLSQKHGISGTERDLLKSSTSLLKQGQIIPPMTYTNRLETSPYLLLKGEMTVLHVPSPCDGKFYTDQEGEKWTEFTHLVEKNLCVFLGVGWGRFSSSGEIKVF